MQMSFWLEPPVSGCHRMMHHRMMIRSHRKMMRRQLVESCWPHHRHRYHRREFLASSRLMLALTVLLAPGQGSHPPRHSTHTRTHHHQQQLRQLRQPHHHQSQNQSHCHCLNQSHWRRSQSQDWLLELPDRRKLLHMKMSELLTGPRRTC